MEPYHKDVADGITVSHGGCLAAMSTLPSSGWRCPLFPGAGFSRRHG
jgi:hypothetical protein